MKHIKQFMRQFMIGLSLLVACSLPLMPVTVTAAAGCGDGSGDSKDQVLRGIGTTNSNDCKTGGVTDAINAAVNILSFVAGIAAVIMVIVSGFRFITSGGDSGKVASARSSLIYALVGVAIAALAQFLVRFVIHKAGTA